MTAEPDEWKDVNPGEAELLRCLRISPERWNAALRKERQVALNALRSLGTAVRSLVQAPDGSAPDPAMKLRADAFVEGLTKALTKRSGPRALAHESVLQFRTNKALRVRPKLVEALTNSLDADRRRRTALISTQRFRHEKLREVNRILQEFDIAPVCTEEHIKSLGAPGRGPASLADELLVRALNITPRRLRGKRTSHGRRSP